MQRLDLNKNEAAVSLPTPLVVGSSKNGIQTPINIPKLELAYNKGSLFSFCSEYRKEKEKRKRKNGEIRIPNGLFTCLCVLSVFYYKRLAYLVLVSDYGPPPHISSYFIFFRFRGKIIVGELGVIGRRGLEKASDARRLNMQSNFNAIS